jgi:RNA polymerase sigma-70 factor (ECF subfamily)
MKAESKSEVKRDGRSSAETWAEMSGMADETLFDLFKGGDREAFNRLVHRYEGELYHYLVRFLDDRQVAEDIFQEAFLQVHQSAGSFHSDRRFRPWLFTIAANKARDWIRARGRRPTTPLQNLIDGHGQGSGEFIELLHSGPGAMTPGLEQEEIRQKVQLAVAALPDSLREILLLAYFHEFPYRQIGEMLGIPLGTVKSRLHSAVVHFGSEWKNANPELLSA